MFTTTTSGFLSEDTRQILTDLNSIFKLILGSIGLVVLLGHASYKRLTGKSLLKMLFYDAEDRDRRRVTDHIRGAGPKTTQFYDGTATETRRRSPNKWGAQ
jgi:hypothetical protein